MKKMGGQAGGAAPTRAHEQAMPLQQLQHASKDQEVGSSTNSQQARGEGFLEVS